MAVRVQMSSTESPFPAILKPTGVISVCVCVLIRLAASGLSYSMGGFLLHHAGSLFQLADSRVVYGLSSCSTLA